jgi:hypothetical protein
MRTVWLAGTIAVVLLAAAAAPASAAVRQCGNYGFPEGHRGDKPIFTQRPIAARTARSAAATAASATSCG